MDRKERIYKRFEREKNKVFTPKELAKACRMDAGRVGSTLSKLVKEGAIERVSRGRYRYARPKKAPKKTLPKEQIKRYLDTLVKTCEIAIHELMLTEPLVGEQDRKEIEHQIAFFARYLVRARWELSQGTAGPTDMDEEVFKRAKRIHEWSKFVFEDRRMARG